MHISGGKCGICGEVYNETKLFEKGGIYYLGLPVRTYNKGQIIDVKVEVDYCLCDSKRNLLIIFYFFFKKISANHLGWFEFRICNVDSLITDATQECLDRALLTDLDGNTRINLKKGVYNFETKLKLPDYLWCKHCVFQWKYHAGNSWDTDKLTGRSCVGCGAQEQFYGCSDITILNTEPVTNKQSSQYPQTTIAINPIEPIKTSGKNYTRVLTLILSRDGNNDKLIKDIQNKTGVARKVFINVKPEVNYATRKVIYEPFTIKKKPNEGIYCPNGDGYYPDYKTNCQNYYICVYSGTSHERVLTYSCPYGQAFEKRLKICNSYDSVICN